MVFSLLQPKPACAATITKLSSAVKGTVTGIAFGSSLNIRSGPSASYSVIGSLYNGATINITGYTPDGWLEMNASSGALGYVSAEYIEVAVVSVALNATAKTIILGEAAVATGYNIFPACATNKTVTWTSSNPAIATIDSTGKVSPKAVGTTTVTVKTADGAKTASCVYTVAAAHIPTTALTNVKVTPTSIAAGGSITITWTKVAGSTKYRIRLYREEANNTWVNIVYAGSEYADYADISSVTLSGLTWTGTYKILAYSGNAAGWYTPGTFSNTYTVVASAVPASAPTNVKTSSTSLVAGGSNTLSWTKVASATRYRVRLNKQNADGSWTNITFGGNTYTDYADISSVTYPGLTMTGTFKFYVYSGNAAGWHDPGTFSNVYTVVA